MNARVLYQLLEFQATDRETTELDKLLLRIYENPALMSYLSSIGKSDDGKTELDFLDLPIMAIASVKKLIGPIDVESFSYDINGTPHVGFRFDLKPLAELSNELPVGAIA